MGLKPTDALPRCTSTMRATLLLLVLIGPGLADAGFDLGPSGFDRVRGPRLGLGLPELSLSGATPAQLEVTPGEGARERSIEPGLALILGVVPGFGVGHYFAGAPQWTVWLVVDIVVFVVWPGGFIFTDNRAYVLSGLLVLAERVVEGVSAYRAAGGEREGPGRPVQALSPAELAWPVAARAFPER